MKRLKIPARIVVLVCGLWAPMSILCVSAFSSDECVKCHQVEADSFKKTPHSVSKSCDICHGSAEAHMGQEDKRRNIVNPAALNPKLSNNICLDCHPDKITDVAEKFRAVANLHDDIRCYKCHRAHLTPDDNYRNGPFRNDLSVDCGVCHAKNTNDLLDSEHGQSGIDCSDCHKLHKSVTISEDIEEEIGKCLDCHPQQELEFRDSSTHPLRERQIKCSDCHNPHSSRYDGMLKKRGDKSCGVCHADIAIKAGKHPESKNTNHPFKVVGCMDCHRPHGSNFDSLLKHNANNICNTCHN